MTTIEQAAQNAAERIEEKHCPYVGNLRQLMIVDIKQTILVHFAPVIAELEQAKREYAHQLEKFVAYNKDDTMIAEARAVLEKWGKP